MVDLTSGLNKNNSVSPPALSPAAPSMDYAGDSTANIASKALSSSAPSAIAQDEVLKAVLWWKNKAGAEAEGSEGHTDELEEEEDVEPEESQERSQFEKSDALKNIQKTAAKIEAVKSSLYSFAYQFTVNVATPFAKKAVTSYVGTYGNFDKERVLRTQKERMKKELGDPQFVAFYDLVSGALVPAVKNQFLESLKAEKGFVGELIEAQEEVVLKLLETIIARAFGNLAQELKEHQKELASFGKEPSLVSLIKLLLKKSEGHLDQQKIDQIKRKYATDEHVVSSVLHALSCGSQKNLQKSESFAVKVHSYIKSDKIEESARLKEELIASMQVSDRFELEEQQKFLISLDHLKEKNEEMKALFSEFSQLFLHILFPNKLADIEEVQGMAQYFLGDTLFKIIEDSCALFLQETYESTQVDSFFEKKWSEEVEEALQIEGAKSMASISSAFVLQSTSDYLASPEGIESIAQALAEITPEAARREQKKAFFDLSNQTMAAWLAQSARAILNRDDPQLDSCANFFGKVVESLSLALMAKGARFLPQGEEKESRVVLKNIIEQLLLRMHSLGSKISLDSCRTFVADLPIPDILKEQLANQLFEKGVNQTLKEKKIRAEEIKAIYQKDYAKVCAYAQGQEIAKQIPKIAAILVEHQFKVLQENQSAAEFESLINEFFIHQAPGVVVDEAIKAWIKESGLALFAGEKEKTAFNSNLKSGLEAVLFKSLARLIEKNKNERGEKGVAAFLNQVNQSFHLVFDVLGGENQRVIAELQEARGIQKQIEATRSEAKRLLKEGETWAKGLSAEERMLMQKWLDADSRLLSAIHKLKELKIKKEQQMALLKNYHFSDRQLTLVSRSLALRKEKEFAWSDAKSFSNFLYAKIEDLKGSEEVEELQRGEEIEVLLKLLKMPEKDLKILLKTLYVASAMEFQVQEVQLRERIVAAQKKAAEDYLRGKEKDARLESARARIDLIFQSRKCMSEVEALQVKLDPHLALFREFSKTVTALLGVKTKEDLGLPPYIAESLFPLIESFEEKELARILFVESMPLVQPFIDLEASRSKLKELSHSFPLVGRVIETATGKVIAKAPLYFKEHTAEIQEMIRKSSPEGLALYKLAEGELIDLLQEKGGVFETNQLFLQRWLESFVLKILLNFVDDEGKDLTSTLAGKLHALMASSSAIAGETKEEKATQLIHATLKDILRIDLEGPAEKNNLALLPPSLRKIVYDSIESQMIEYFKPIVVSTLSAQEKKEMLQRVSDSDFMSTLAMALAKDAVLALPRVVSADKIAENIAEPVFGPHAKEKQEIALSFEHWGEALLYKEATPFLESYFESVFLDILIGIAEKNPRDATHKKDSICVFIDRFLEKLEKHYFNKESKGTFEEKSRSFSADVLKDLLGISAPTDLKGLPPQLQEKSYQKLEAEIGNFINRLKKHLELIRDDQSALKKKKEEAKALGESEGRAVLDILTQDIMHMVLESTYGNFAESIGEEKKGVVLISKNIETLLKSWKMEQSKVAELLLGYSGQESLKTKLESVLDVAADSKHFEREKKLAEELTGNWLFEVFHKATGLIVDFEKEHKQAFNQKLMARVLHLGADHLRHLNQARAKSKTGKIAYRDFIEAAKGELHPGVVKSPVSYKQAIEMISERLYSKISGEEFQLLQKEEANIKALIAAFVKKEALGERVFDLQEWIEQFDLIHRRIVKRALSKEEKEALKRPSEKGLTLGDVIRQEAEAPSKIKQEKAVAPAIETLLAMMFPNGAADLYFVSEELREQAWNILQNNLLPLIVNVLIDTALDPATLNLIALKSLENLNLSLQGEIPQPSAPPEDFSGGEIEAAAGELIAQVLHAAPSLPKSITRMLESGQMSEAVKKSLGATLLGQFNDTFIKEKLMIALKNAVSRDEKGKPLLNYEKKSEPQRVQEKIDKAKQTEKELKKVFRETINQGIFYYLRSLVPQFLRKITTAIDEKYEKADPRLKSALKAIAHFLLNNWITAGVGFVLGAIRDCLQDFVYDYLLSLDKSRQEILTLLTDLPEDQPEGDIKNYAIYHENLIYRLSEAVYEVVEEFLEKRS